MSRAIRLLFGALIVAAAACGSVSGDNPDAPPAIDAVDTFTVTVAKNGDGTGTVASAPAGIDCGTTCSGAFPIGTSVTLTATPAAGSTFLGWSGGCSGTGACTVSAAATVTAAFALNNSLVVTLTGTGVGTVTSSPADINCGTDCSESFAPNTVVTLTATADPSSTFMGWSGGGCSGTGTCVVTITAATGVNAAFAINSYPLMVVTGGNGSGTVTSSPAGITCGADCVESYAHNTTVTLTAAPSAGSSFAGWSGGGCTGVAPTCTVTVTAATTVSAAFTLDSYTLAVALAGTGMGTVTSAPGGISCGADCSEPYPSGTMVTLTASPAAGSAFAGWSGGGCTGTGTCVVTVTAATTVTATFNVAPLTLTVARTGTGTGTVTSSPAGINCGATCSASFAFNTVVTLTAAPAVGSTFAGWSGSGCSGTGTCTVVMTAATSVTATFTLNSYPLSVTRGGTGTGTVTSAPAGINCGATCSATYNHGTAITLTAAAAVGSTFAGWSGGGCSGTGTCVVTLTAATTVTATFTLNSYTLSVTRAGTGTGTVTSSPAGINCGATCSATYNHGTVITLTATPVAGSTFAGWSGGGCSGTGTCTITLTAAASVTATFNGALTRIGHTADLGDSSSHGANFLLGEKVTVSSAYSLRQMGVLVRTAGPQMILALYTDVGGHPGNLVAQTAVTTMVAGTMEVPITAGAVPIAAGTYWIMGVYNTGASIGYTNAAGTNQVDYTSLTFGSALPNPFGTASSYTGQSFNYWIVVQ